MHRLTKYLLAFNSSLIKQALKKLMYKPKMLVKLKPFVSLHFQYIALYEHSFVSLSETATSVINCQEKILVKLLEHTINIKTTQINFGQQKN